MCPCVRSASGASNLRPVASNLRCLTLKEELSKREKKKQLLALSSEKRRLAKGARPCALALPVPLLCALARLLPNAVRVQMVCAHMAMRQQGVCWRRARMRLATPCTASSHATCNPMHREWLCFLRAPWSRAIRQLTEARAERSKASAGADGASADGASIRDPSGLSAVEVGCQTRA